MEGALLVTDLMDTFYNCVSKTLVADILEKDGEYLSRTRYMEEEMKRVITTMDKDIAHIVDNLVTEQLAIGELRECACFLAGFRMGLELTR